MASSPSSFPVGASVLLRGLVKGARLNGSRGVVKSPPVQSSGRQGVYVHDEGKSLSIRPVNLEYEPRELDSLSFAEMKGVLVAYAETREEFPVWHGGPDRELLRRLMEATLEGVDEDGLRRLVEEKASSDPVVLAELIAKYNEPKAKPKSAVNSSNVAAARNAGTISQLRQGGEVIARVTPRDYREQANRMRAMGPAALRMTDPHFADMTDAGINMTISTLETLANANDAAANDDTPPRPAACRHRSPVSEAEMQKLREEIDAQRNSIIALPPSKTHADEVSRMKQLQGLLNRVEEYELIVESRRVESVVRAHEELHPPATEDCPVCLEKICTTSDSWVPTTCCGNGLCIDCFKTMWMQRMTQDIHNSCPLCRGNVVYDEIGSNNEIKKCANDGQAWAQCMLGACLIKGEGGFPTDTREGLKWLKLAADQKYPKALGYLGRCLLDGLGDAAVQSNSSAMAYLEEAADLGDATAQTEIGNIYQEGLVVPRDEGRAIHYLTLARNADERNIHTAYRLGKLFWDSYYFSASESGMECLDDADGGLSKWLVLAKHYFQIAAEGGKELAYFALAQTLFQLLKEWFHFKGVHGHDLVPRLLFWARKAAKTDTPYEAKIHALIQYVERMMQLLCSNCFALAENVPHELKRCSRCRASWYCDKNCQAEHWKDSHKHDCVQQD